MGYNPYDSDSNMLGPYPLTEEELSKEKYDNRGVYLLGKEGIFSNKVMYVGRGHLRTRLKDKIGKYSIFYYRVLISQDGRFKKECAEFHRYGKANDLDNKIHPSRPNYGYPKCTEIGCDGEPN